MQNKLVEFEDVDLGYGRRAVLTGINFSIDKGSFFGIVGPNGAGKTTMLRAILGMLKPLRGQIRREPGVRFAYVPQRQFIDEVYPLTALEVALMGRYPRLGIFSRPGENDRKFVMGCLEHVSIADLAGSPYRDLSGGQKQRVLIARALAAEPGALALDEPTNDMDIGSEHSIMELLKHLQAEHGITVIMVSHLLNVVVNYAGTLALLNSGLQVGSAKEVLSSENLSDVYGIPVDVACCGGRSVVITRGKNADV